MAEYNFWDDRTTECNDDNFCPIINCSCCSQDCEHCKDNIEFSKWIDEHEEKERTENG